MSQTPYQNTRPEVDAKHMQQTGTIWSQRGAPNWRNLVKFAAKPPTKEKILNLGPPTTGINHLALIWENTVGRYFNNFKNSSIEKLKRPTSTKQLISFQENVNLAKSFSNLPRLLISFRDILPMKMFWFGPSFIKKEFFKIKRPVSESTEREREVIMTLTEK